MPTGSGYTTFFAVAVKFFFLMTPFFVTTTFLAMTAGITAAARRRLAVRVAGAALLLSLGLLFFGNALFAVLGITVDAFRVGAGGLLFLTAVGLVRGNPNDVRPPDGADIAVVPLAIPVTIGPATIGALLITGAEGGSAGAMATMALALLAAVLAVGLILWSATALERLLGRHGLAVLSKITGLILAAMSAEMLITGAANLWRAATTLN